MQGRLWGALRSTDRRRDSLRLCHESQTTEQHIIANHEGAPESYKKDLRGIERLWGKKRLAQVNRPEGEVGVGAGLLLL